MESGDRNLLWEGCWNVRDLGGLPCESGRIQRGVLVRASSLHGLSDAGWQAAVDHGVKTVVDLRTDWERARAPTRAPEGVTVLPTPLEDGLAGDPEFDGWGQDGRLATPLYYRPFLERWPERCVRVLEAIASAPPGGLVVHCSAGRDRTGMVVALLLSAAGTPLESILDDYDLSQPNVQSGAARAAGMRDDTAVRLEVTARYGTTPRGALAEFLGEPHPLEVLRDQGLDPDFADRLRARLGSPGARG